MRYKVAGLVVKAENAAKSASQPCQHVLDWINELPRESVVLDYGCGKLRYTIPLSRRVRRVYAVDSDVQVNREQQISGEVTSLRSYARKHLPNVAVCEVDRARWERSYDHILLANVLSAITTRAERVAVLSTLRPLLQVGGLLFACTQFRNTYFKTFATNPHARWRGQGWLVQTGTGTASFYGVITLEQPGT